MSVFGKDSGRADVDERLDFLDDKLEPGKNRASASTSGRALPAGSDSVPDENTSGADPKRRANQQHQSDDAGDAADDTGGARLRRNLAANTASADANSSVNPSTRRRSGRKPQGADAVQFPIKRPPKSIKSILAKQAREGTSHGPGNSSGNGPIQSNGPGQRASSVVQATANSPDSSASDANRLEQQHQLEEPNHADYDDPLSDTAFDFLDDGQSDAGPGSRRSQSQHRREQFDVTRVGTGQSVPTYLPPSAAPERRPPEWRKFAMVAAVLLVSAGVVLGGFEYLGNRTDDRSAALDGLDRTGDAVVPGVTSSVDNDEAGSEALVDNVSLSGSSGDLRSKSDSALLQLQALLEKGDAEEASQLIVSIDPAVYGYGQPEFLQLEKTIEQQLLLPREQRGDLTTQNQTEVEAVAATQPRIEGDAVAASPTDVAASDVAADIGANNAKQAAETAALLEQARKIAEETNQLKAEAERIAAATRAAKEAALVAEQKRAEQVRLLAEEQAAAAEAKKLADERAAAQAKQLAEQQEAAAQARKLADERAAAEARRLAEERAAAAEAQRLAEERAAADARRVAEQKAEIERARLLAEERAAATRAAAEARQLAEEQAAAASEAKRLADEKAVAEAKRLQEIRQGEQLKQQQAQAAEQQRLENERLAEQQRAEQAAQVRQRNSEAEANRQAALAAQRERLRAKAAAEQERSRELTRRRQQERETALAQAAATQQAEQAARAAQREQVASNQRGSSSGAPASNDVPASRPATSQITITEIAPLEQIIPAPSSAPISDQDLALVYRKFQSLERALEEKNMEQVLTLTEKSSTKIGVFLQLFNNFESMDIRIEDISARNASSTVVGRLRIKTMTRENGERSIPSDIYRDTVISSTRQNNGDWSRISW